MPPPESADVFAPRKKFLQLCMTAGFQSEAMENNPSNLPERELEARLTKALAKIPDAPVPSNFTARVLDAIELDATRESRSRDWTLNWRALWPRVAAAAVVLLLAGVSLGRYEIHSQRVKLVKNLAQITASQPLPSVDALVNLDVIQRMSQSGHADGELLAALQ
jgi:hypothetical protein